MAPSYLIKHEPRCCGEEIALGNSSDPLTVSRDFPPPVGSLVQSAEGHTSQSWGEILPQDCSGPACQLPARWPAHRFETRHPSQWREPIPSKSLYVYLMDGVSVSGEAWLT